MYFKISKKTISEQISIVSKALSLTSPLPVLHNVKLLAKENYLQLTASDSDISIQSTVYENEENGLQIIREGSILLDGRYLNDMVRKIDVDQMELEVVDGTYTNIRGMAVNFELNGIKAENYPLIDFNKPETSFVLKADDFKKIINQTCFACSDKETRPVLTGLNLNCNDNELTCVATDSYRLAEKKVYLDESCNFNITVPAKNLLDIVKIVTGENDIEISLNDKKVMFVIDNVVVQTRLIDGLYPETSRLIPTEFTYELVVDARDILNALDRASFIKNEGVCIIKMDMNENEINFTSRSSEIVSSEKVLPVSYTGEPLSISYKCNYVYDAIRALNAMQVKIQFCGNMKPFILRNTEDDGIMQLVLPIKTYA